MKTIAIAFTAFSLGVTAFCPMARPVQAAEHHGAHQAMHASADLSCCMNATSPDHSERPAFVPFVSHDAPFHDRIVAWNVQRPRSRVGNHAHRHPEIVKKKFELRSLMKRE